MRERYKMEFDEAKTKLVQDLSIERNRANENNRKAEHLWRAWRKEKIRKQKEM